MDMEDNELHTSTPLPDFEDEVTAQTENADLLVVAEPPAEELSLPAEETVVEQPAVEEVPVTEEVPVVEDPVPAPAEETVVHPEEAPKPEPTYGAPQPLFEDIIPVAYTMDEKQKKEKREKDEKKAALARKQAEKDAAKAEKEAAKAEKEAAKKAKEDKKKSKEDKKKETPVDLVPEAEQEPDFVPVPLTVEALEEKSAPAVLSEEKPMKAPEKKEYTPYEKRLRRQYKLNKDLLLSANDVVPGFVIAKGENVIRTYNCLAGNKGEGTLCLTNKRLLVNTGERSEMDVRNVTGIKYARYTKFSIAKFIFGLIFLGLGVFMILLPFFHTGMNIPFVTGESWKSWFPYLFYSCGGVSVLLSLPFLLTMVKKSFYFYVFAREDAPFVECKSSSYAKREQKGKTYKYMIAKAGKESEKAARELGALIIEVKDGRYDF